MIKDWHKDAIIYAVDVAKFADSDGNGVGDLRGLTAHLPYLAELGVTCIWMLPCYPTPDRDNGYDISNYYGINPNIGSLDDFTALIQKAGENGIQVLLDLVVNHTSSDHPWFKAAERDAGSRLRDYYVWADTPPPIPPDLKGMFPGEESTVWTHNDIAGSFYFHRFYHFEPDLNFANPEVLQEVRQIMDFWLSFGISGFRLDAAAPMVKAKGIPEAHPENPHEVLRGLFGFLQERRPEAVMLGEVDVEPERLQEFMGQGDQMNLLFNFLLNNYLYLGMAREEAEPILRGMGKLPRLPEGCQWANFLRNLDELDLEQLAEDERAEVMDAFAPDPDMRIFGRGIRRRLATMLGGDQRRLELAMSLLFSLPGAPVVIYGDEIGMGDDLSEPGRRAVRAPMQWNGSANAGFSTAKTAELTQPVIKDGPFSFKKINVEAQLNEPTSLLSSVKRFIRLRRQNPAIGSAAFHAADSGNPAVLSHSYNTGSGRLLMLHNLSGEKRGVSIDLGREGRSDMQDLITDGKIALDGGKAELELEGYGYQWYFREGL